MDNQHDDQWRQPEDGCFSPITAYLRRLAPGSQRTLRTALDRAAEYLSRGRETAASYRWESVTDADIQMMQQGLGEVYKSSTINKIAAAVRGVARQARHQASQVNPKWVEFEPPSKLREQVQETLTRGRYVGPLTIKALLGICLRDISATGARDAAIIAVLAGTGIQRSELVALKLEDYHRAYHELFVAPVPGRRERAIPISENVCCILDYWLEWHNTKGGPIFVPTGTAGQPQEIGLDPNSITKILIRRSQAAGVEEVSPRDLRYTYINTLFEQLRDHKMTQSLAGLNDEEALAPYINPQTNQQSPIIEIPLSVRRRTE